MKKLLGRPLFAGCVALAAFSATLPSIAAGTRLILTNGSEIQIKGPVERKDGLVLFRMPDGTLGSLNESMVRRVETGDATKSNRASARGAGAGSPGAASSVTYTNDDLAPLGNSSPLPEDPAAPPAASPAPGGSDRVVAGATGNGDRLAELGRRLQTAEAQRNEAYRTLVCAQHEISLDNPDCKTTLLPRADNNLSAEQEGKLRARYRETENQVEDLQLELKTLRRKGSTNP